MSMWVLGQLDCGSFPVLPVEMRGGETLYKLLSLQTPEIYLPVFANSAAVVTVTAFGFYLNMGSGD